MNVLLCGLPGCGKTYFGRLAALQFNGSFIDTDQLIETKFQSSCRNIVLHRGEPYFRSIEREVLLSLKEVNSTVIALGGGALCLEENIPFLRALGWIIYLKSSRLRKPLPPHLQEKTAKLRIPIYEQACHQVVDVEKENVLDIISTKLQAVHLKG